MMNSEHLHHPGCYGYIRSSKDKRAMLYNDFTIYDEEDDLWFEHIIREYEHYSNSAAQRRMDENTITTFAKENPELSHKEVFYTLDYNSAGNRVDSGRFILTEYKDTRIREFCFWVSDISMEESQKYIDAAVCWHYTNRFEIGHLVFFPCSGPWVHN